MELKDLLVRKASLLKGLEKAKQKKKEVLNIVQTLVKEFNSGRIDKREYDVKLGKALGGKNAEKWVKYYDDYLDYYKYQLKLCERLIKEERGKEMSGVRIKVLKVLIGLVLIGIVVSLLFSFGSVFVDYIGIGEKNVSVLDFGKGVDEGIGVESISQPVPTELEVTQDEEFEPEVIGGVGETIQYPARVGEPVRFMTKVDGDFNRIILPAGVEIKSIKIVEDGVKREVKFMEDRKKKLLFFGEKSVEVSILSPALTGKVIGDNDSNANYELVYELPGPKIFEEKRGNKKRILVQGREDLHFKNVLVSSDVNERVSLNEIGKIKVYRIEGDVRREVLFSGYDSDEDGLIDRLEWIVPRLSDAVYEIVIYVKEAEHLDSDRNLINDIYEEVSKLDDIWSGKIYNNEYVRVYFQEELSSTNDITVYARGEGQNIVEVYKVGNNEKIIEFSIVNGKNKIFLSEMEGKSDGFDLKIVNLEGGYIEIDYIVDPVVYVYDCNGLQSIGLTDNVFLMNDIDCSGINDFNPIGNCGVDNSCGTADDKPYIGNFNGQGNKIIEFSTNGINPGLFGYVGPGAVIENVGLEGSIVTSGASKAGGLVGFLNQGIIRNSYSKASVTGAGSSSQGGLVGMSFQGTIENSYATGAVSGGSRSGGLVGEQSVSATITNSYAIGSVSASGFGSMAGAIAGYSDGNVKNSFATNAGSPLLLVYGGSGTITNSYFNVNKNIFYGSSHAVYIGTPVWDFTSVWLEDINNLPILRWELYIPKTISDCEELQGIGTTTGTLSNNYVLAGDIDCSDTINWNGGLGFNPIGDSVNPFTGNFDGDGFVISGLFIDNCVSYKGLFGKIGAGGNVKNLGLNGVYIKGGDFSGGLAGSNYGVIEESYVKGNLLVCNEVRGGGLAGDNQGIIRNAYTKVDVIEEGVENKVGGMVGLNNGVIENSYATGNVNSNSIAGGFVGYNTNSVVNSFATGTATGILYIGGLVGLNAASVSNSWFSGGPSIGPGTFESDVSNFYSGIHPVYTGTPNWDFTNVWLAMNNDLPILRWESIPISNCLELQGIGGATGSLSDDYVLTNDIDCSDTINWNSGLGFNPIGDFVNPFTRTLDGNGFIINGLYINRPLESFGGLFSYIGYFGCNPDFDCGVVKNIGLEGATVISGKTGGLTTYNYGSIENSHVTGIVSGTALFESGGLTARNFGNIKNSYSEGTVRGVSEVGGLAGINNAGANITNSYSKAIVIATGNSVGGLVGNNDGGANINNSHANGYVSGVNFVGGLVGYNNEFLVNTYATGNVNGNNNIGGLVGYNFAGGLVNSFAIGNANGNTNVGGLLGSLYEGLIIHSWFSGGPDNGIGYFESDVQNFYNRNHNVYVNAPNWDFNNIWYERFNGLPILEWEILDINSCMFLNQANKVYRLVDNVEDNSLVATCFRIRNENVTLDCDDYSIRTDANVYGVDSNRKSSVVRDCNISAGNSGTAIVLVSGADNSTIFNNILISQYRGLYISGANSSLIKNNLFLNNSNRGVYFSASSNNLIVNNSANNNTAYGFVLAYSPNNQFFNITANNNTYGGILLNPGSNNSYFENVSFYNNTNFGGLTIRSSFNNTIKRVNSKSNLYGVLIDTDSDNNTFIDSNLSENKISNVRIAESSSNNTFLNVSYDITKEYVEAGSDMVRQWYYRAYVDDGVNPVSGAKVAAENQSDDFQFEITTDSLGYTSIRSIIDYVNLGGQRVDYDNHFLYAYTGVLYEGLYDSHYYTANKNNLRDVFSLGSFSPPEVVYISDINGYFNSINVPSADRNLLQDNSIAKTFEFYVWIEDLDYLPSGIDVNDGNALLTLKKGSVERKSSDGGNAESCVHIRDDVAPAGSVGHVGEAVRVYSCSVAMFFYDDYGSESLKNWGVKVMIKNYAGQEDSDSVVNVLAQPVRNTFFNKLEASKMIPTTGNLNYGSVEIRNNLNKQPSDVAGQYPLQIVNTGNSEVSSIKVTGYDIPGVSDSAKFIRVAWFSVGSSNPCSGNALVHSVPIDSGLATIIHGPSSSSDLRVCLREVQASASQQEYKTNQGGVPTAIQWIIDTWFLLVAVRIGKKKDTEKKNEKKRLRALISEDLFEAFEEKLKGKYGIDIEGLLGIAEERKIKKKGLKVPVDIFREGGAEVLTKYLKENSGLKFSEIAELINRDSRTVGVNYGNAVKKKRKVEFIDGGMMIPIEVFADRNLSVMESVVGFLKEKGLRNNEIALMLGKDARVVGTLLSRVKKKMNRR